MATVVMKSFGIWIILVMLAILNGAIREKVFAPYLGQQWAARISSLLLLIIIFVTTLGVFPFLDITSSYQAWIAGGIWFLLTIAFEFLFGHFVVGESWSKLLEAYNVLKGNLWTLDLLITAISPYLAGKMRGVI